MLLQVFSINVYALLDHSATLYFETFKVAMNFNVLPDVLIESFSIITLVGDSVVANRFYRSCPILLLPNKVTLVDLVELDMVEFDVILGMD